MKTIWVVQYNDGTADVWDTEKPSPAWPYVDAFEANQKIGELKQEKLTLESQLLIRAARIKNLEAELKDLRRAS